MADTRIERDCLGEMEIPNDRYYGIQTTRMKKVSGAAHLPIVFYPVSYTHLTLPTIA